MIIAHLRKIVSVYLVILLSLFMLTCQSLQPGSSTVQVKSWSNHYASLKNRQHWHLKGKIGFSYVYQGENKLVSANFDWQKRYNHFDMRLSGPLGMGEFVIEKSPQLTVLTNHKGMPFSASSPEALFERHTGKRIPWSDMEWWVLGIPAPGKAFEKTLRDDLDLLAKLQQSDWQISYVSYQDVDAFRLPTKIKLVRDDMKVTIIVRNWELY